MKTKVPGKLMIAGEYAVLEPNQHAVVVAVDRYVTVDIEPSHVNLVTLPDLGLYQVGWRNDGNTVVFSVSDSRLRFIQQTISVLNQFLKEQNLPAKSYHLTITSQLADSSGRKYGLGSSAAIVVAVVTAIVSLYKLQLTREKIFKLAAIAHLKTQGNGSGADIAAATFGGWIDYSSFRAKWVLDELEQGSKIGELLERHWPNLTISPITPPRGLKLCVGWTGEVARTAPMVNKIQELRDYQPDFYQGFLTESNEAVTELIDCFASMEAEEAIDSLSKNRNALRKLGEVTGVPIETNKLRELADLAEQYGSGKSSGAGGGDCGIAFVSDDSQKSQLHQAWEKAGIQPLDLNVSQYGFTVAGK